MKLVKVEDIPKESKFVSNEDLMTLYSTCQNMQEICLSNGGIGLSAVQVGIPWKLFVYWDNFPKTPQSFSYILDAEYKNNSDSSSTSIESCLSIKNTDGSSRHFKLNRFDSISVSGKILKCDKEKPYLENFEKVFEKDIFGVVFQHEIDHQNNVLISNLGEEIFLKKI